MLTTTKIVYQIVEKINLMLELDSNQCANSSFNDKKLVPSAKNVFIVIKKPLPAVIVIMKPR